MANESIYESRLTQALAACARQISPKYQKILAGFVACYKEALGSSFEQAIPHLLLFLELVQPYFKAPFPFELYHRKIRHPIDYYRFGMDFIRPLIDLPRSKIFGQEHLDTILAALKRGENCILLANHQTEGDPQAISILLEQKYPEIAEQLIYVAGERVLTDPLAIPFSMGCDLLCIYSKRYIDSPPELKAQKQMHNKHTMEKMSRLLKEGGKIIYVAPSGGRDRKNQEGQVEVARFDPASIEMFYLMAKKAKTPTHFIPFALATYDMLPPPETIQKELGEIRKAKKTPVFLSFASAFDMEIQSVHEDKIQRREERAERIWSIVDAMYKHLARE